MNIQNLLEEIKDAWIKRVSQDLARGMGVRENFEKELARFFNLLEQAIVTGDPSWLDPLIYDWANSPTESDLAEGRYNLSTLIARANAFTFDVAKEKLSAEKALELLTATSNVFSYALSKAAHYESGKRISYMENELAAIIETLEKLDRSKSSFISVAAHELKTPLTLIEGYTAMIGDIVGEQATPLVDGVHSGVSRLREIVNDMIDVSLIDNSLLSLNFQPFWINQSLALLQDEMEKISKDRDLTL